MAKLVFGSPRDLARSRRKKVSEAAVPARKRWPNHALQDGFGRYYGVGDDARSYWGRPG
jgi:hypothetical protein